MADQVDRACGVIIVEVINSNPNGDPDNNGAPRMLPNETGFITPVAFKAKIRELVAFKSGTVWQSLKKQFALEDDQYGIVEAPIDSESHITLKDVNNSIADETYYSKFFDSRVFGAAILGSTEKVKHENKHIRGGGPVCISGFHSLHKVEMITQTTTRRRNSEEGVSKGFAPDAIKLIAHGIYKATFEINPQQAKQTECTRKDIELLLKLFTLAFENTRSSSRPSVNVISVPYVTFADPFGWQIPNILKSLSPIPKDKNLQYSTSSDDYVFPDINNELVKDGLKSGKIKSVVDLAK